MSGCHFLVPGALDRPTGGSRYDREIVEGLRGRGLSVAVSELPGRFPDADGAARTAVDGALAALPDGTTVVVDGLVLGGLPEIFSHHTRRLRLHALIHHPLADESGIDPVLARRMLERETRAVAQARCVITTSGFTASRLRELGIHRGATEVIEPGCSPRPLATGSGDGTPTLLCVAALSPRKAQHVLLDALSRITDRRWRCRLAGPAGLNPAYAAALSAQRDALGLASRVALEGTLDAAGLDAAYQGADLFVLPSRYEGYGMVINEAMAYGLPVVTTTGGALARTLPRDAGLAVPPDDTAALARALQRLLDDHALRQSLAEGARRARDRLTGWAPGIQRFMTLLDRDNNA
ncbi:glycosyltransferase family 4 protein [Spiribacter sp. 221]|uniref:glycosyltransferase family 4 protein n=1 Tax=Spiribacter onubensis TaxID=3122420 RepID=UPI00349FCBC0